MRLWVVLTATVGFILMVLPLSAQFADRPDRGLLLEAAGAAPYNSVSYFRQVFTTERIEGYIRAGVGVWSNHLAFPVGGYLRVGTGTHHGRLTLTVTPHANSFRVWNRAASDIAVDFAIGLEYVYQFSNSPLQISGGAFPYIRLDPGPDLLPETSSFSLRPGLSVAWIL